MRYQVDFLLLLKIQKISSYFGLCRKVLFGNQLVGFFTFNLFDLLILIPGAHCYIVLVLHDFYPPISFWSNRFLLQHKSGNLTPEINPNNTMYLFPVTFFCIYSFLSMFLYGLDSRRKQTKDLNSKLRPSTCTPKKTRRPPITHI